MATTTFQWANETLSSDFTDIIDVRSPSEFELDHLPGAINLPVLSDEERVETGILYKRDSFAAKKMGAAKIARNIAHHLEGALSTKAGSFYPLVYCWRGGMRSQSLGIILSQVGFRVAVLKGGYRTYRHQVLSQLENHPKQLNLRILAGLTGTAKTRLLHRMSAQGFQVLDLEGLANHKGSLLGSPLGDSQPSQKFFESGLAHALARFDPERPVWVECESNKIGALHIPSALWRRMQTAPVVELTVPLPRRVEFLLEDYDYFLQQPSLLKERIRLLSRLRGAKTVDHWCELIDQDRWEEFVQDLLVNHYDPTYRGAQARWTEHRLASYTLDALTPPHMDSLVSRLGEELEPDTRTHTTPLRE